MNKPKVWIVKEQMIRGEIHPIPMDYSQAFEYGEIKFITTHDMPIYGKGSVQDVWNKDALRFAIEYDEMHDYIIVTGQPTAIFCIGWLLGDFRKIPRFLIWRREENKYRVMNFDATFLGKDYLIGV